ncbi:Pentatricopeptide repeat-containing protein, chloroplastic [Sesamum angolense]|uniref:Pentatricopeptide repeat-containing protein, chloroplastic n=1 Tax=Sesamum angolense TaxID=2727404 RepID=A0AAE1WYB6_9LAMI|nr:Pentatricopeptide repeat-containing protein, chloroplastic [Sesamum angolense]
MEVFSLLGNSSQPVFCFSTTRPIKNFKPIAATFATPAAAEGVSASVSSNGTEEHSEVWSKRLNVSKHIPKNLSAAYKTRESAILDIQHSSELASALSRSGEVLKAQDLNVVLRHFGKQNRWKDLYQLLVGCAKVKGGYVKAMELVREIKYRGLQMDIVVYGTLISVCASNNQCEEAEKYFNEMKSEGHSPNVFHYSSLLNAYAVDGNYKKADELIQEMRSAGLVLNKVILTTLLKVYVKGGLFEKSRELMDELQDLGYAEDEMPYCLLMDGLVKSGKLMEAKSVFDGMRQKEVKNDGYSYSIMISALCRGGLIEEAKQLACEFEIKYDKYDVVILNSMLGAYCRSGEMENVMKLMKKMDESAISPDWNTFHILIKYFCKEQLYLLAYRTMADMHRKGHQPEEGLAVSLINHLGKTGSHSEAFSVYSMLRYSKRTINRALHEKILHILLAGGLLKDAYVVVKDNANLISQTAIKKFATSFMRKGNINLVNDVIKSIHSSGNKIDLDIFHMAVSRYIEQPEKKELLLHLLQWMPGQGYHVDSSTRNLIFKNSHLFGDHSTAELLSKHHAVLKTNKSHEGRKK